MQRISFFLGVLLTIAFIGVSCDKEEPQYDTPQISVVGESLIDLKPGLSLIHI